MALKIDNTAVNIKNLILNNGSNNQIKILKVKNGSTTKTLWSQPVNVVLEYAGLGYLTSNYQISDNSEPAAASAAGFRMDFYRDSEPGTTRQFYYGDLLKLTAVPEGLAEYTYTLASFTGQCYSGSVPVGSSFNITNDSFVALEYHPTSKWDTLKVRFNFNVERNPHYTTVAASVTDNGCSKLYLTVDGPSSLSGVSSMYVQRLSNHTVYQLAQFNNKNAFDVRSSAICVAGTHGENGSYYRTAWVSTNRTEDYAFDAPNEFLKHAGRPNKEWSFYYDGWVHIIDEAPYVFSGSQTFTGTLYWSPKTTTWGLTYMNTSNFDTADFVPGSTSDSDSWTKATASYSIARPNYTYSQTITPTSATFSNYNTFLAFYKYSYYTPDTLYSNPERYYMVLFNLPISGQGSSYCYSGVTYVTIDLANWFGSGTTLSEISAVDYYLADHTRTSITDMKINNNNSSHTITFKYQQTASWSATSSTAVFLAVVLKLKTS